jgi:endo-1,3(4)-beta-glucanase
MLDNLILDNLSSDDSKLLTTSLTKDIDSIRLDANSSYFGAKNDAKIARLAQIADSLGQTEQRDKVIATLTGEMENWFNYTPGESGKYFSYDSTVGGLIANTPEFDSSNFNDHHFHYGYFIYAAAVLAKYNPEFARSYNSIIESIIKDIANPNKSTTTESFPHFRNYDYYEGHSWASGYAPFGDGNNQESTSEAINAWYSIWLWGRNTGNVQWENTGIFLYSNEVNSAKEYWLQRQTSSQPIYSTDYKNKIVSIVWGSKIDYATFFSKLPLDIYGIQYLPITPASIYLYDTKKIASDDQFLSTSIERNEGKLGDLVSAYLGMVKGKQVLSPEKLATIPIDDGNSRTNLYYWLMFWDNIKGIQSQKTENNSSVVVYERKDKSYKVLISCRQEQDVVIKVNGKDTNKTCKPGTNLLT